VRILFVVPRKTVSHLGQTEVNISYLHDTKIPAVLVSLLAVGRYQLRIRHMREIQLRSLPIRLVPFRGIDPCNSNSMLGICIVEQDQTVAVLDTNDFPDENLLRRSRLEEPASVRSDHEKATSGQKGQHPKRRRRPTQLRNSFAPEGTCFGTASRSDITVSEDNVRKYSMSRPTSSLVNGGISASSGERAANSRPA
jgi:hypothetical protein